MTAVRRLFAILLVGIWLPATLHCSLEAAGMFASHEGVCCPDSQACAEDGCGIVETGAFRSAETSVQIAAPDFSASVFQFCFADVSSQAAEPMLAPAMMERPRDWVPAWQFVQRAAPPARAPSLS